VVVQADKASSYEMLVKVLDAARAAKVTNVAIAAED
jgi:biopolymer transport protein ExbD